MVFTYQTKQADHNRFQPRYVGIAFEHENFVPIHEMRYVDSVESIDGGRSSRVYYYILPIDGNAENISTVYYRYIVDGVWIEDPSNPSSIRKISGVKISAAKVSENRTILPVSPRIFNDSRSYSKIVHFMYRGNSGENIFLAGNFNNWDPFMYRLNENSDDPGMYEIRIRLLPGEYHYNYYYQGRRIKDPLNLQWTYDIEGYEYSYFSVGS